MGQCHMHTHVHTQACLRWWLWHCFGNQAKEPMLSPISRLNSQIPPSASNVIICDGLQPRKELRLFDQIRAEPNPRPAMQRDLRQARALSRTLRRSPFPQLCCRGRARHHALTSAQHRDSSPQRLSRSLCALNPSQPVSHIGLF